MPPLSSHSIQSRFAEQGFVGPIDVLSKEEATTALTEVSNELEIHPKTQALLYPSSTDRFKLHLILPIIDKIVHHPLIIKAVQAALQTQSVCLWSSDINWKSPKSMGFFAPHQDSTYAGLSPPSQCLTAWIALSDPVGENEGCLTFYRKSHLEGQIPHFQPSMDDDCYPRNNMLSLKQYISQTELDVMSRPVTIPLKAGQMTLHSFFCVHASGPNQHPTSPRVGLALRYFDADSVAQTKGTCTEMVTFISGDSSTLPSCFELEPRLGNNPTKSDLQRMRRVRAEAMRREQANYFGKNEQGTNSMKCEEVNDFTSP